MGITLPYNLMFLNRIHCFSLSSQLLYLILYLILYLRQCIDPMFYVYSTACSYSLSLPGRFCFWQCAFSCLFVCVTNTTKYADIIPVRKILYWLLVRHCAVFKTAQLVCKFV